jgi:hypothetical protein
MSEETEREIAEREIGRSDDKRKTPERRSYRTGSGRRRSNASKNRPGGPDKSGNPLKTDSSAETVGQRRSNHS